MKQLIKEIILENQHMEIAHLVHQLRRREATVTIPWSGSDYSGLQWIISWNRDGRCLAVLWWDPECTRMGAVYTQGLWYPFTTSLHHGFQRQTTFQRDRHCPARAKHHTHCTPLFVCGIPQNPGYRNIPQNPKNRSTLIHYTEQFMHHGGFPETIGMDDHYRIKLLQEYFNVMMFRDIVERYQVTNIDTLRFFIRKIFSGVTKLSRSTKPITIWNPWATR